ncbi:L-aspartate oxidase [Paracoccus aestuariivivens]|uniref:L-aspartate oxidase n=1 Tax=Paracoccus aestuariivivens TaxID=1820333 RepID=A0A6L6JA50_9RHOB|nr:L-aspartate oxidase [Paracoccus aestuariivivens]
MSTGRIVILGAGLAALSAALRLAPRPVLVISPEALGQGASSVWAQGGVAAAMDPADTPEAHACDTVNAGAGLVDPEVARLVTNAARSRIFDLTEIGTPFDRTPDGGFVLSREAAHGAARVVRVKGDQAGAQIMKTLIRAVRATPSIQVLEGVMASGLEVAKGRVDGVRLMRASGSQEITLRAPAVLLAAGGSGGLFAATTNPHRIAGAAIGMAARAGAVISDPEFVQFHPTAMDVGIDPAPLASEALRGEGAHLLNANGERFMLAVHPDAELAPRDIVARAVYLQSKAGLRPALDTRHCLGERILTEFPAVAQACARAGIDPTRQPIPVAAAAHYHMGGVETDDTGRSSLSGLWACGEAASTGLHGANRLASNGLLEALVFADRCADSIAAITPEVTALEVELPDLAAAPLPDPQLVQRLRRAMTLGAGVVRDTVGLMACLREIDAIENSQPDCTPLLNMTATARLIAYAALNRQESRGAHFRSDYPQSQGKTGQRTRIRLTDALPSSLKETA